MGWLVAVCVVGLLAWSALQSKRRAQTTSDHLAFIENRMVTLFGELPSAAPEQVARLVYDELENRREKDIRYFAACSPATAHRVWRTMQLATYRDAKKVR